jgi:Zinc-binding dehydrogenase
VVTVRGDLALMVTAGLVVVRRATWTSPSSSSVAKVVSETVMGKIDRRYRFTEIPAAIEYPEQGHARGKVVVGAA